MSKAIVSGHPIIQNAITELRDKQLKSREFRRLIHQAGLLLAYEATKNLETKDVSVNTPFGMAEGKQIKPKVAIVPVLRGGLGLQNAFSTILPDAPILHIGVIKDPKTQRTSTYYSSLAMKCDTDVAFVLDPVCATGAYVIEVIKDLKEWGVKSVKFITVLAAPEGIERIKNEFPDVEIYAGAIDQKVDDNQFIVPGLGHAGNRLFLSDYNPL